MQVFLPGELHGQRILAGYGYGSWGWKESDMAERLTLSLYFLLKQIEYNVSSILNPNLKWENIP